MIQITDLSKKYNGVTVLDIPHLSISHGETFGLVGNNGAGKTTLFRLVLDLIKADSGSISIDDIPVAGSSKGNQKKIGIAAAMLSRPDILILDEPFTALDPSSQIRLKKMLNEHATQYGTTMLISSHDLNHVTEVSSRIVVLQKGEIIKDLQTNEQTLSELEQHFAVEG